MHKCLICDISFKRNCDLIRHETSIKHKKNLNKENDNKINNNKINDNKINDSENPLYCKICNKLYIKKYYYEKHLISNLHLENLKCIKIEPDYRVAVINKNTLKVKYGKNAPLKSKLNNFLIKYPNYEIYNKTQNNTNLNFLYKLKNLLLDIIHIIDLQLN